MTKKHRNLIFIVGGLTVIHLLFCIFYQRIYGYFNLKDQLGPFLTFTTLFRGILLGLTALLGWLAVNDKTKRALPIYLLLFLFNLILPHLFQ